jgi:branched-chain amino acid transport system substrate-binding protein
MTQLNRRITSLALLSALTFAPLASQAQQAPVRLGVIYPTKTAVGKANVNGAEIAAQILNEQGGILGGRKIELVIYDDNLQAVDTVAAARRLINQDGIQVITGTSSSTVALAVLQIAKSSNALFVAALPKHPDVTASGYDKAFRVNTSMVSDQKNLEMYLQQKIKPSRLAVVAENSDWGRQFIDDMKKTFGSSVVASELIEMTQTDLSTVMTKVRASNPDVVCTAVAKTEQNAAAVVAMASLGMTAKKCLPGGMVNQLVTLAGPAAEGAFGTSPYSAKLKTSVNELFINRFKAKLGFEPGQLEAIAFESVWAVAKAMDSAKTSTDLNKVSAALRADTFQTPRGEVRFETNGQATAKNAITLVVKAGQLVVDE